MELTSEQAHHLGGIAALLIAILLGLAETGVVRAAWVRYLVPVALFVWGVRSVTHPRPAGIGAGDHGPEAAQHVLIGALTVLVAIVEGLRAGDRLRGAAWGLVLPAGLLGVGALFFFHAQHASSQPALVLIVQHRIIGVTLGIAAATRALAELPNRQGQGFRLAWLTAVLLFGLELVMYSEGGGQHLH